ncbi:unnamed protein product [Schistocephalus solidus]|uniref:RRM domain-containing protein n=1 Tax=Schistocephalus solidus TaxID=70667 RepID=A0A183SS31_SCHSO|nr:unnamed protein product [Schistocephalus solidus]
MSVSILRIRGLPYSATADDVINFFKVFRSDEAEMKRAMGWQPERNRKEHVARLRGLPYDTDKKDIFTFFSEERSGGGGPMLGHGRDRFGGYYGPPSPGYRGYGGPQGPGGPPGYGRGPRPGPYSRPYGAGPGGYGQRPPSPRGGYGPPPDNYAAPGMGPNESKSMTGHAIRMRGLPYSVTPDEIAHFLAPLQPVNIHICYNAAGRPTGEADGQASPGGYPPRPYGPPFYSGGGGSNGTGRYSGEATPNKFKSGYYEAPSNGMYGGPEDFGCPPDERYGGRREGYGGPMEPRRTPGPRGNPFIFINNRSLVADDGYEDYGEREEYYW